MGIKGEANGGATPGARVLCTMSWLPLLLWLAHGSHETYLQTPEDKRGECTTDAQGRVDIQAVRGGARLNVSSAVESGSLLPTRVWVSAPLLGLPSHQTAHLCSGESTFTQRGLAFVLSA